MLFEVRLGVVLATAFIFLVLVPVAPAFADCPAGPVFDGDRTTALLGVSRQYFPGDVVSFAEIEADLGRDFEIMEETAAALALTTDESQVIVVAETGAAMAPERAPGLMASLLIVREDFDFEMPDTLLVAVLDVMIAKARSQANALIIVASDVTGRDDGMLAVTLGILPVKTDMSCALARGGQASDSVWMVLGK